MLPSMLSNLPHDPPSTAPYCMEDQSIKGLAIAWILLVGGTIVVSLRVYVKTRVSKNHWWDDYMAVTSLLFGLSVGGIFTRMASDGMGQHLDCLQAERVASMLELSTISDAMNILGIGLVKICVCLTLVRIFDRSSPRLWYFLWFMVALVAITHLALALLPLLRCRPLAALWDANVQGDCMSTQTIMVADKITCALDVLTTLICAILPLAAFRILQMNAYTKIGLGVLIGLAAFTAVCPIVKILALKGVTKEDYTWKYVPPATWAAVEQFLGVTIASIPPLKPFFQTMSRRSRQKRQKKRSRRPKRKDPFYWAGKDITADVQAEEAPKQKPAKRRDTFYWLSKDITADAPIEETPKQKQPKRKDTFYWAGKDILSGAPAEETPKQMVPTLRSSDLRQPPKTTPTSKFSTIPQRSRPRNPRKESVVSNASTIIAADNKANGMEQASVLEKGFQIGSLEKEGEEDWLWEWELPDVADRGSAMFAIPYMQSQQRSRAVSPQESWQGALRKAL